MLTLEFFFHTSQYILSAACLYAERGIATASRLSVRPSVRNVEVQWSGWKFSKIISPLVSLGVYSVQISTPPHHDLLQKGTPYNSDAKWPTPCWIERHRHSMVTCGRMVSDNAMVDPIGNHHRSFHWYDRWPLRPPLPSKCPKCTPRCMSNVEWPCSRMIDS